MSTDYDIEMSLDDTLELDAIIQEWSNISDIITKAEHTNDSTSHKNDIKGIQTNTAIFNPPKSGKYKITVNGQELTVKVTDPSSIPDSVVNNAYGWYDAENLTLSNGSLVSTRPDQSGSGNDLSGSGTFQASEVNNKDSVGCDGVDDLYSVSNTTGVPKTWFVVFRWDGGTSNYSFQGILGDGGSKNNRNMLGLTEDTNEWQIKVGSNTINGGTTDQNWHVGTFKNDGSNGFGRIDGVEVASGRAGTYNASENIIIGARSSQTPVYFSGSVPEAIFVSTDVSLSDIEQTEQALANEYGITL